MTEITEQGRAAVAEIARRAGVSVDAAMTVLHALQRGHGSAAQFNHPELGGMGQWSRGGMTQIGDMFNDGLKAKVTALCTDLAAVLNQRGAFAEGNAPKEYTPDGAAHSASGDHWWPDDLGGPSSTGGQNDSAYALFPDKHRLAVRQGGTVSVYDSGDHEIGGFAQAQGGGGQTLRFTSQHGTITTDDLKKLG